MTRFQIGSPVGATLGLLGTAARAGVLLLAAAAPGAAQQPQQGADLALVQRLLLDQQAVITPAQGAERAAAVNDRLNNRDAIVTTANTRAAIKFTDDGSTVRLNPSSQLVVTATGERADMVKTIELDVGELWARVTRGEGERRFQVQTPVGVAAVKGTDFIVRVAADGTTTVITLEGVVEFFNQGGTADVNEGNLVTVAAANAAPQPRQTRPEDLQGLEGLLEDDAAASGDTVQVEVTVQDPDGRSRTIVMELPREQARAILGGGE
jgi:hypothetical protein